MATAASRSRGHRFRAPPPTPIATGRGLRSAVVDDWILSAYLESSLKVPELTLPESCFPARPTVKARPDVDLPKLLSGEEAAILRVLAAAAEIGAFRIVGGGEEAVAAAEVREAIEAGCGVFGVSGELERGDGIGKVFYWRRPMTPEDERALEEALPDTYRTFREKMDNVAAKLEMVAERIAKVLSEHMKNQSCSIEIAEEPSILSLTRYDSHDIRANRSDEGSYAKSLHSHALSLYVSGDDHEFWIRSPGGSACFKIPAGSILVTIGGQLQEWSNGEFKSASGKIVSEPSDDPNPSFCLEFMSTPAVLRRELDHKIKKVSLMDQLLIMLLLLVLFYSLWNCISSKFTST